jgi:hypothetical protein
VSPVLYRPDPWTRVVGIGWSTGGGVVALNWRWIRGARNFEGFFPFNPYMHQPIAPLKLTITGWPNTDVLPVDVVQHQLHVAASAPDLLPDEERPALKNPYTRAMIAHFDFWSPLDRVMVQSVFPAQTTNTGIFLPEAHRNYGGAILAINTRALFNDIETEDDEPKPDSWTLKLEVGDAPEFNIELEQPQYMLAIRHDKFSRDGTLYQMDKFGGGIGPRWHQIVTTSILPSKRQSDGIYIIDPETTSKTAFERFGTLEDFYGGPRNSYVNIARKWNLKIIFKPLLRVELTSADNTPNDLIYREKTS